MGVFGSVGWDMQYINVKKMDLFFVALRQLLDGSRNTLGAGMHLVAMMIRDKALAFFIFRC